MIPSRAVLASWRTSDIAPAGEKLQAIATAIDTSGMQVQWKVSSFQATPGIGWEGRSADAAADAADRAWSRGNDLGRILSTAAGAAQLHGPTLVAEKAAIGRLVETIEAGDLYVDDQWTVLVRKKLMKPAMAKLMALAAQGFQDQLNPHLVNLGKADTELADSTIVQSVAFGIETPRMADDPRSPKDVVPDLWNEKGRKDQQQKLVSHMVGTVVGKNRAQKDGKPATELRMLDGGKQIYSSRNGTETTDFYDSAGKLYAIKDTAPDGTITTRLLRDGQSPVLIHEKPGGPAIAEVDGVELPVPTSRDINSALAGGAMAAAEPRLTDGMPYLTAAQAEKVAQGAKLSGPALTILGTAISVAQAKDGYEYCVAGTAGGVALAGDVGMMLMTAPAGPLATFVRATGSSIAFGMVGNTIGQLVCK